MTVAPLRELFRNWEPQGPPKLGPGPVPPNFCGPARKAEAEKERTVL